MKIQTKVAAWSVRVQSLLDNLKNDTLKRKAMAGSERVRRNLKKTKGKCQQGYKQEALGIRGREGRR
jgi:hypothetical protein